MVHSSFQFLDGHKQHFQFCDCTSCMNGKTETGPGQKCWNGGVSCHIAMVIKCPLYRLIIFICPRCQTPPVPGLSRHRLSQYPSWHLNVCPWQSALWVAKYHPCLASQIFSARDAQYKAELLICLQDFKLLINMVLELNLYD